MGKHVLKEGKQYIEGQGVNAPVHKGQKWGVRGKEEVRDKQREHFDYLNFRESKKADLHCLEKGEYGVS